LKKDLEGETTSWIGALWQRWQVHKITLASFVGYLNLVWVIGRLAVTETAEAA